MKVIQSKKNPIERSPGNAPDKVLIDLITHVETRLSHICDDIRAYPAPIPACDAQFNYLIEQRAGLSEALNKLQQLAKSLETGDKGLAQIKTILGESEWIDPEVMKVNL